MAVSAPVRAYYTKNIFLKSSRTSVPANFRPLDVTPTGKSSVEGCAGGGKNILELFLMGEGDCIVDLRASCGLCNPAMYAAADIVCDWGRGKTFAEALALDPADIAGLAPFFAALGGPGRPDDAREKFQYVVVALQNAIRSHRGEPLPPTPKIAPATDRDLDVAE
jgi:hypothetical protein